MTMLEASDPIPFGEWLPDLENFNNPGALVAENCLTEGDKYKPFPDLVENGDALPADTLGSFAYRDAAGNVTLFAGTATKLYKQNGTGWDDVTRSSGGDYSTASDGFWDFKSFDDLVICTNYNDDIQVFDVGSDSEFSQLSATAPRCRSLMVFANFLIALDVVDGDGANANRVSWGPINNPQGVWTAAPTTTQADSQDLRGKDFSITGGVAFTDYALIIQGKTIWRMQYQGGATIFSIVKVEEGRGSTIHRSIISDGKRAFFLDSAGYYMHVNGNSIPIGNKKIDKTILALIDRSNDHRINTSIDSVNKVVMLAFPSIGSVDGRCDKILIYNWADERFTIINQRTQLLFTYLSTGYTLEGIDALFANLDTVPYSLDSQFWIGGKTLLGAFSVDNKLSIFNGDPKTARIGTPEVRANKSGKTTLHNLIPYVEGGTKTARLGCRDTLVASTLFTAYISPNGITDEFEFMKDAVFHRAEVQISGSWTIAHGVAIRADISGSF